uniref:Hydrophobin n=1 Tax=Bionectria ochroleuca TaxID=29856 RepID=A0A8H7KEJ1_BIOOC
MKAAQVVALLGLASLSYAQAPSPTESIGCEPHGDHWSVTKPSTQMVSKSSEMETYIVALLGTARDLALLQPLSALLHCEGPATSATSAAVTTSASEDHDHDHSSTVDPGPSPTESVGCQPHGDHWHCEGPAVTSGASSNVPSSSSAAVTTTSADHDDHSHGSATPTKPSPTESVGCEPHGDHWHCDGPRVTSSGLTSVVSSIPTPSSNGTITTTVPTAMAAGLSTTGFGVVALAGTFAVLLTL